MGQRGEELWAYLRVKGDNGGPEGQRASETCGLGGGEWVLGLVGWFPGEFGFFGGGRGGRVGMWMVRGGVGVGVFGFVGGEGVMALEGLDCGESGGMRVGGPGYGWGGREEVS